MKRSSTVREGADAAHSDPESRQPTEETAAWDRGVYVGRQWADGPGSLVLDLEDIPGVWEQYHNGNGRIWSSAVGCQKSQCANRGARRFAAIASRIDAVQVGRWFPQAFPPFPSCLSAVSRFAASSWDGSVFSWLGGSGATGQLNSAGVLAGVFSRSGESD